MSAADAWAVADPTLCPVCHREACEDHLPAPTTHTERPRLTFATAADVISTPRPVEIIEGIAWAGCLTVLVSESGTGKTFVLLDAAAAVSDGVSWQGRTVEPGSVAYLSYEGDALGLRLRALREVGGRRLERVYVLRAHDPLSPHVSRDGEERSLGELAVVAALEALAVELRAADRPPITLVVIDTVRASLSGSEDSSEHVAAYLRAVRRLMACVPRAAAILAHHAGWQDGDIQRKRERGSSAWRGNCDATLYLEAGDYDADRGEAELTLRTLKVRDAERPAPLHFIRRRVELLEMDRHGGPVTSCIIEPDCRTRQDREAEVQAAAEREHHESDLRLLRAIAEHPESTTSKENLRLLLAAKREIVYAALGRILRQGWVRPPEKQRQPYTVTPAGQQVLAEGSV